MQLFAGKSTNQNREYYKVNDNNIYFNLQNVERGLPKQNMLQQNYRNMFRRKVNAQGV